MKRSPQNQLLTDILAENDLSDLKRASLQSGLAVLRQRRERRRTTRALALAALPVLLAGGILVERSVRDSYLREQQQQRVTALAASKPNSVQLINDEELFALFPNRSLALVGKPGHQELVFLDH